MSLIKLSEHTLFQPGLWIKLTFKKGTEIPKGLDRTGQQVSINLRDKFLMLQLKPLSVVCRIYFFASLGLFLHLRELQDDVAVLEDGQESCSVSKPGWLCPGWGLRDLRSGCWVSFYHHLPP